jgi:hypothetical protein
MPTYTSPLGSPHAMSEQVDLPCSCSIYTGVSSVLWGSVLSSIGFFTSLYPSQPPFLPRKELALSGSYRGIATHACL